MIRFVTFSNLVALLKLYRFDCGLRELIFTAIQAVEIALRSKMIHHILLQYGAFGFTDESLFRDLNIQHKCIEQIKQELKRTREEFIIEHSAKYTEPEVPPVLENAGGDFFRHIIQIVL